MLEECVQRVKSGNLTQRDAEKEYNIRRSTIKIKLIGKHPKPVSRPPVLSFDEERLILNRVQLMCDYGFPATPQDVRHYIKCYLDTKNRTVEQFKRQFARNRIHVLPSEMSQGLCKETDI